MSENSNHSRISFVHHTHDQEDGLMKKSFFAALMLFSLLCTGDCCYAESAAVISLGAGLPDWELNEVYTSETLAENAAEEGLSGIYTSDAGLSDIYIYSFPKEGSITLEEFGRQLAAERHIFCNMMTDRSVPTAVLNYFDRIGDKPYIVQAYVYETDDSFIEVCTLFKTRSVPFGSSDLSIHMISEYNAQEQKDSPLLSDTVYQTENDRLPLLRVREFLKDGFPAEIVEPELISGESFAALSENGWTLEEFVSIYGECFELSKGEVTCRNDFNHAFIGYINDGIFYTRAFIDDGEVYVLLSAEAEASKFQHITNALIDAVERTGH